MNERGYWTEKSEVETHEFDSKLCETIVRLFKGSFIDIGCGDGSYTRNIPNCVGYDGSPLTKEPFKIQDFSIPVFLGKFDNVLSLEVGEHIPKEFESIFFNNLVSHATEFIILSWAIQGQPGTGHVNCQNNDYVIKQMEDRAFIYNDSITLELRENSTLPWFKDSIMVFQKFIRYF